MDPREALADQRRAARARLVALTGDFEGMVAASRDSNADDEHDAEGATIAFERQQVDSLIRHTATHLAEIEAALARLDAGEYGMCERCGQPISPARLEARPTARTCVTCRVAVRRARVPHR